MRCLPRLGLAPIARFILTGLVFWQILQLYVASYQAPGIWKEAWKHLVSVISVQIIRDVEAFVARHPFADADVMRFVVAS